MEIQMPRAVAEATVAADREIGERREMPYLVVVSAGLLPVGLGRLPRDHDDGAIPASATDGEDAEVQQLPAEFARRIPSLLMR
jgi:hypothetical protein